MNRNLLKKALIISGLAILIFMFIKIALAEGILAVMSSLLNSIIEYDDLDSNLIFLGIIFLICGVIIDKKADKVIVNTQDNYIKLRNRYKKLKFLGYLPFVGTLSFAIYSSVFGIRFLDKVYGIEAFYVSILLASMFGGPLYIIGIILIIIYSRKLKKIEKTNN